MDRYYLPVVRLGEVPIYPIDDVERSIRADAEDVEQCESFALLGSLEHEQLRQDRDGLQVYRKGPQNLPSFTEKLQFKQCLVHIFENNILSHLERSKSFVYDQGKQKARNYQKQ
jgi:hypothetical protein